MGEWESTVVGVHGAAGAAWLERLSSLLEEIRRDWSLEPDGAFPLSYAYVEPVRRADGTPAVLKLTVPDDVEARREAAALERFGGEATAAVLARDEARGALLLERLKPGTPLAELAARDDDGATLAAAGVMRRLRRPPGPGFPDAATWGRALYENWGLPRALVVAAREEHAALCASSAAPALLHGDLHHLNVLRAGGGWKAIDPKGVLAEPAYETGALLRNPLGAALTRPLLERRIGLLAGALQLDGERIRGWGRVQAVLAAAWSVHDGQDPAFFLDCARLMTPR